MIGAKEAWYEKKNKCVSRALIILGNYGMLVMMNSR